MNSLKVSYFFQSLVILLLMVFPREATKNTSEYINEILNRNTKNIEVVPYCEKDSRKVKDQFKTARKTMTLSNILHKNSLDSLEKLTRNILCSVVWNQCITNSDVLEHVVFNTISQAHFDQRFRGNKNRKLQKEINKTSMLSCTALRDRNKLNFFISIFEEVLEDTSRTPNLFVFFFENNNNSANPKNVKLFAYLHAKYENKNENSWLEKLSSKITSTANFGK